MNWLKALLGRRRRPENVRGQGKASFGGMTVNERLVLGGLIGEWDEAVRLHDRARMTAILAAVDLGNQAEPIIESALRRVAD